MTGIIIALTTGLLVVSSAVAATPSEIAKDLADGKLDGTYTQQELANYLRNATVQGYPLPPQVPTAPIVPPASAGVAGVQTPPGSAFEPDLGVAGAQSPLDETAQVGSLPFTGIDLALLMLGGVLLLALGLGARRTSRRV